MSAPTVTPYGALSARKLTGLARKISEAPMASNAESLGRRAGVPSSEFGKLVWHLVDARLLPPGHPAIIDALGGAAHEQPAARLIAAAAHLAPVPPPTRGPSSGPTCILPSWPESADRMLWAAAEADLAGLEALLDHAEPALRLGIQLVRGRRGLPVPDADRLSILDGLAEEGTKGWNPPAISNGSTFWVRVAALGENRGGGFADLTDLALHFGSQDEWTPRYVAALGRGLFCVLWPHLSGLVLMPLPDLLGVLAVANINDVESSRVRQLIRARPEPSEALVAAFQAPRRWMGMLGSMALLYALERLLEEGGKAPSWALDHSEWCSFPPANGEVTRLAWERVGAWLRG